MGTGESQTERKSAAHICALRNNDGDETDGTCLPRIMMGDAAMHVSFILYITAHKVADEERE